MRRDSSSLMRWVSVIAACSLESRSCVGIRVAVTHHGAELPAGPGAAVPTTTGQRARSAMRAGPTGVHARCPRKGTRQDGTRERRSIGAPSIWPARSVRRIRAAAPGLERHTTPTPVTAAQPIVQPREPGIVALARERHERQAGRHERGGHALPGSQVGRRKEHAAPLPQGLVKDRARLGRDLEQRRASTGAQRGDGLAEKLAQGDEGLPDERAPVGRVEPGEDAGHVAPGGAAGGGHQGVRDHADPAPERSQRRKRQSPDARERQARQRPDRVVLRPLRERPRAAGAHVAQLGRRTRRLLGHGQVPQADSDALSRGEQALPRVDAAALVVRIAGEVAEVLRGTLHGRQGAARDGAVARGGLEVVLGPPQLGDGGLASARDVGGVGRPGRGRLRRRRRRVAGLRLHLRRGDVLHARRRRLGR